MYRAKNGFVKREIAGETILIPVGSTTREFNGMITLNETGAFLWDALQQPGTEEDLLAAVLGEFEATEEEARGDLKEFLETGLTAGVIVQE